MTNGVSHILLFTLFRSTPRGRQFQNAHIRGNDGETGWLLLDTTLLLCTIDLAQLRFVTDLFLLDHDYLVPRLRGVIFCLEGSDDLLQCRQGFDKLIGKAAERPYELRGKFT